MIVKTSIVAKSALLIGLLALIDAGEQPAYIVFYDGVMPSTADSPIDGVLLGTLVLSKPAGVITDDTLIFNEINDDPLADADGLLGYGVLFAHTGAPILIGDCGLVGSTAFFKFERLRVYANGIIRINSGQLNIGD